MNAQKAMYRTQSIVTTRKSCIGMAAGLLLIGAHSATASVVLADGLQILAGSGQTQTQQELDLYACATWATDQTGFDPVTRAGGIPAAGSAARDSEYRRAMGACLQARGYTVSIATPTAPPAVSPADSRAPPGKWDLLGNYDSPVGDRPDTAVIDLTASYNYDYIVYYVWVGGGLVQQGGNWTPRSQDWAFSNLDIDCKHHTFREHRFINRAGSIPRSDDRWVAIEAAWQPIQLAEKQVCEQFQ
jgi:hypothetical protein